MDELKNLIRERRLTCKEGEIKMDLNTNDS